MNSEECTLKKVRISIAFKKNSILLQVRQSYDPCAKLTHSDTFSSTCQSNAEAILGGCPEKWKSQIEQNPN